MWRTRDGVMGGLGQVNGEWYGRQRLGGEGKRRECGRTTWGPSETTKDNSGEAGIRCTGGRRRDLLDRGRAGAAAVSVGGGRGWCPCGDGSERARGRAYDICRRRSSTSNGAEAGGSPSQPGRPWALGRSPPQVTHAKLSPRIRLNQRLFSLQTRNLPLRRPATPPVQLPPRRQQSRKARRPAAARYRTPGNALLYHVALNTTSARSHRAWDGQAAAQPTCDRRSFAPPGAPTYRLAAPSRMLDAASTPQPLAPPRRRWSQFLSHNGGRQSAASRDGCEIAPALAA